MGGPMLTILITYLKKWAQTGPIRTGRALRQYHHSVARTRAAANYVFCDGSVHGISYSIDAQTWIRVGIRNDGLPIDAEQF